MLALLGFNGWKVRAFFEFEVARLTGELPSYGVFEANASHSERCVAEVREQDSPGVVLGKSGWLMHWLHRKHGT